MTFGINRVHGSLISPKSFAGVALQDFTLTFWQGDSYALRADAQVGNANPFIGSVADGALDQVFRTAAEQFGTVSRVGTLNTGTGATANYIRFAVETLGFEPALDPAGGFLGTSAAAATTAAALQAAINGLATGTNGWVAGTTGVHLSSATVALFAY
jgi:hypothetical protein